jgi:hypothetical protein
MNVDFRDADRRRLAIAQPLYTLHAQPAFAFGGFQRRAEIAPHRHHALIVDFEFSVGRILSQLGNALHLLPIRRCRLAPEHLRANAGLPVDEAESDELLDRLAHRKAARTEPLAQLHLGRHEIADRLIAGLDLIDERSRDLLVARLRRRRHCFPAPSRSADRAALRRPPRRFAK